MLSGLTKDMLSMKSMGCPQPMLWCHSHCHSLSSSSLSTNHTGLCVLLSECKFHGFKKSSLFILIFSFSIVLVCSCRLYLGMHTLYDIIIGLLISSLILLVTIPFSKYWSHSGWGKETCQLRWDSELRSYTRTFKYFFTPKVAWIHRSLKNLLS